jgi:hypothetical protein
MKYTETIGWDWIKADIQKGLKHGIVAVKKGAMAIKKRSGEMTEEGKRQYKIMMLKSKAHRSIFDLGAETYDLMRTKSKNPALDAKVKDTVVQIRKIEALIAALEKKSKSVLKKSPKKAA